VDRSQLFNTEEDKINSISRKGHGTGVMGC
jgi:hypothetical protein